MSTETTDTPLLPDPDPRPVHYTVISVDDHLVEPPHLFAGRMPAKLADLAPEIVKIDGADTWVFDDKTYPQLGLNAVVGHRRRNDITFEPTGFADMRPGCYEIEARIADMDINGVWASMNFPSMISGFCGAVYSSARDRDLGVAVTRAFNDWVAEEWWGPHPDRIIPLGVTYLADPELGADEVRRNAARGFRAVSLPEQPHRLGYPSLHSGWWDPVLRACEETGTVACLHVASSGNSITAPDAPKPATGATLFSSLSFAACVDWLWSGVPVRFPKLRIALSEGGIGWVPMMLDRLEYMMATSGHGRGQWMSDELSPTEVIARNFWFCTIDDPSTMALRHRIGIDRITIEVDYPHADSSWPDTQEKLRTILRDVPDDEARRITHLNAAALFDHPLPPVCVP